MSRSIECVCIDDKNKPKEIPGNKWVKKDDTYHVTHVFIMRNQNNIQGCELAEFDISMHEPYNCYRLSRFAFTTENLLKLIEMIKDCDELNSLEDVDIQKMVEDIKIKETV